MPDKSLIVNVLQVGIDPLTSLTGQGDVKLSLEGQDLTHGTGDLVGIPDYNGDWIKVRGNKSINFVIANSSIIAGKIKYYITTYR
jgi:hypothetical protein